MLLSITNHKLKRPKVQRSKGLRPKSPKAQKSKNPKSKNPQAYKSKSPFLFLDFWTFGLLDIYARESWTD